MATAEPPSRTASGSRCLQQSLPHPANYPHQHCSDPPCGPWQTEAAKTFRKRSKKTGTATTISEKAIAHFDRIKDKNGEEEEEDEPDNRRGRSRSRTVAGRENGLDRDEARARMGFKKSSGARSRSKSLT